MGRRTASVLPEPVGAISRTLAPFMIFGMAADCGGVGVLNPDSARASRIVVERFSKACSDRVSTNPQFEAWSLESWDSKTLEEAMSQERFNHRTVPFLNRNDGYSHGGLRDV